MTTPQRFDDDVEFLRQYADLQCFENADGARMIVVPKWQGRIVTSTFGDGAGLGWINRRLIESQTEHPQANLYGGEDRVWIAPEGGQFSFFFPPDAPFSFEHWRCPRLIDTEPFSVTDSGKNWLSCSGQTAVQNHRGNWFEMRLERRVALLERREVGASLAIELDNAIKVVGHESRNVLINAGDTPWTRETGLPALWVLGMFEPSDRVTMIIPYVRGEVERLGPIVTADYFGHLDETRLQIDDNAGVIYFRGDGNYRSKLGLAHRRAMPRLGSWDAVRKVLTVVEFDLPAKVQDGYVNNLWTWQAEPWSGDVVNAYNDGPQEGTEQLGPFYELETLSPALALEPGKRFEHRHRTLHFQGTLEALSPLTKKLLGVELEAVAFQ